MQQALHLVVQIQRELSAMRIVPLLLNLQEETVPPLSGGCG